MSELDGEILAFDRRDFARIGEEAEQLALGQFDDDAVAIAGIVRSDRAGGEVRLRDTGLQFFEPFGRAGEGGGADMGFRRLFKRDEIGEAARSAQIMGAASHFGGAMPQMSVRKAAASAAWGSASSMLRSFILRLRE